MSVDARVGYGMVMMVRIFYRNNTKYIHSPRILQCSSIALKDKMQSSTVDQADVDKHTKQLKEWWDPNGSMKALHSYNLLRYKNKN